MIFVHDLLCFILLKKNTNIDQAKLTVGKFYIDEQNYPNL